MKGRPLRRTARGAREAREAPVHLERAPCYAAGRPRSLSPRRALGGQRAHGQRALVGSCWVKEEITLGLVRGRNLEDIYSVSILVPSSIHAYTIYISITILYTYSR